MTDGQGLTNHVGLYRARYAQLFIFLHDSPYLMTPFVQFGRGLSHLLSSADSGTEAASALYHNQQQYPTMAS
jgi:hypothetical protein